MAASKRKGDVLSTVKPRVYGDVVEVLGQLHESAKAGDVTGIVIGATLRGHHYITDILGNCHRNPTYALGIVQTLAGDLQDMIKARGADETR